MIAGREWKAVLAARAWSKRDLALLRSAFMNRATADGTGGDKTPAVRWWIKYCVFVRGVNPFTRLTAMSPLEEKLEAEELLMDFCLWLAICRPSGKQISAKTIQKYVSTVRAWHLRRFRTHLCGDLDYGQIRDLIKGIKRIIAQPAPRKRWGVRTQELSEAIRRFLSKDAPEEANWRAALQVAFCGLLRGAEFALQDGETFNPKKHLTRADVKFGTTSERARFALIRMLPAKGDAGMGKWVPLELEGGGTLLDPVAALEELFRLDPVPEKEWASTPLFRRSTGLAFKVREVRGMVRYLMASLGLDPLKFGAHSLRIGGATAALAADMSPAAIRTAGRWASDVYIMYTRANRQSARRVARVVGSTPFEDTERGVFFDDDLLLTPETMAVGRVDGFIEAELIDDALADEDVA
jgi:hypothetical protein